MHDLKAIRNDPEYYRTQLARRRYVGNINEVLAFDTKNREFLKQSQDLQARHNVVNDLIKQKYLEIKDKTEAQVDLDLLREEVASIKQELDALEVEEGQYAQKIYDFLLTMPNLLLHDVPDGWDEDDNVEIRVEGEKPKFDFKPLEHQNFVSSEYINFTQAAKVSGSRFVYLHGDVARLERALANFMLDIHTSEFGYQEVSPPLLVRDKALLGTGQLPKFEDDLFKAGDYYLIPTSEVPITNLVRETILKEDQMPLRFAALTPCFRSEAGSAGKDTRGMIRQHQFSKVELVSIVPPEYSDLEHERMLTCAETILQKLGLSYRVMLLCAGDTGFSARKTFDIEVWLPGQNRYREISSVSNCGDFQARRMNARYKDREKKNHFVHTLNGSGLAVGRCLIAILENFQQKDGSVHIPDALKSYMNNTDYILT